MVEVWKGNILLSDSNIITDVGLASPNVASSPLLPTTTLRFLTTVDAAKIPLYLAAGPSLDVWTTSEATEAWFESLLLSKPVLSPHTDAVEHAWWTLARAQSPIGILAQVESGEEHNHKPRVTEILFYGTIAPLGTDALPTPPSSSPEHDDQAAQLPALRVHAIPLSSDLLYQHAATNTALTSPAHTATEIESQFLPPQLDAHSTSDSPKRMRDIFEEATIANKKARSKGGAGIAAAAARGGESQPSLNHRKSLSIDTKISPFPDGRLPSAGGPLSRPSSRQLSRSPSISSETRPLSRKGLSDAHNKRSHLSHVATASLLPEEPTTESRNKEALSRVVMAAMRMHGLQQRKRNRSRRASVAPEDSQEVNLDTAAEETAKDEEYKLMYHQTYKGAAFAFRKHIVEKPLHAQPDRMRDVVEKLLAMFLNDPLAQALAAESVTHPVATPGSKARVSMLESAHSHASPFDLPSAARPSMARSKTDSHAYTGSPVSRRKVGGTDATPARCCLSMESQIPRSTETMNIAITTRQDGTDVNSLTIRQMVE